MIKLALDREALNALFPPGSEARVELARAVSVTLIGQLALKDVKHLSVEIKSEVVKVMYDELRQQGMIMSGWGEHVSLSERARGQIRDQAVSAYNETMRTEVVNLFHEKKAEAINLVEAVVQQRVERGLKDLVKVCIKEVLAK